MLRCLDCGRIFDEDEIAYWEEYRGEFWGSPAYETVSGCPSCYGDYEEFDEDEEDEEDDDEE